MEGVESVCKDDSYYYTTLNCQWSSSAVTIMTVHLKILINNVHDQQAVLKAYAFIVGKASTEKNGVYHGFVTKEQAFKESRYVGDNTSSKVVDDDKAIGVWLQDARLALLKQDTDSNCSVKDTNEYVHCLQQAQNDDCQELLTLFWKIKLGPFSTLTLGRIHLSKITTPSELVQQVSCQFVEPLISSLLVEKKSHQLAVCEASKNEKQLHDDNKRLLNQIILTTDCQQQENRKLFARFLKVLNTKKQRLAIVEKELTRLKQQQQDNVNVSTNNANEKELQTVTKRKQSLNAKRGCEVHKKSKLKTKTKEKQFDDSVMTIEKQTIGSLQHSKVEPMETDDKRSTLAIADKSSVFPTPISCLENDLFEADTLLDSDILNENVLEDLSPPWLQQQLSIEQTVVSPPPLLQSWQMKNEDQPKKSDNRRENDLFEADTLIDSDVLCKNAPEDPSPPRLQQRSSVEQTVVSPPPLLQTLQMKNEDRPKKSVLDNLWSGIW